MCPPASEVEMMELMKVLLQRGLSVNDRNSEKESVLHIAVTNNSGDANDSTALEEFLLGHKVDIFAKSARGDMPIHCVFQQ